METQLPRVLFITPCAFNQVTGGGITFSNLFRGWPQNRLATVTDDPIPVRTDVCENYFHLTRREIDYVSPLNWIRPAPAEPSAHNPAGPAKTPSLAGRLARWLIGNAGVPERARLTPELRDWITRFSPDVIYTILGRVSHVRLYEQIRAEFKIPAVIHLMDDGVVSPKWSGIFSPIITPAHHSAFRSAIQSASARIAIGEDMQREYEQRFGMPFTHLQNALDVEDVTKQVASAPPTPAPPRLIYIGSLLPFSQLQSVIDCANAVRRINQMGTPARLEIYAPQKLYRQHTAAISPDENIHFLDAPENDADFFRILASATVLLMPVNFDADSIRFIRLSMPTKLPAYLAAARPILFYGPPGVAQIEYARRHDCGLLVDSHDEGLLTAAIIQLLGDPALRQRLSAAALESALARHDAVAVRHHFQQILSHAAQSAHAPPSQTPRP